MTGPDSLTCRPVRYPLAAAGANSPRLGLARPVRRRSGHGRTCRTCGSCGGRRARGWRVRSGLGSTSVLHGTRQDRGPGLAPAAGQDVPQADVRVLAGLLAVWVTVTNMGSSLVTDENTASMPNSSRASRRTVAAGCSPGSTWPPVGSHSPALRWSASSTSRWSWSISRKQETR